MVLRDDEIKNYTLHEMEEILNRNGCTLAPYEGMDMPKDTVVENGMKTLIVDELAYDIEEMKVEHGRLYPCLTDDQRSVYETLLGCH